MTITIPPESDASPAELDPLAQVPATPEAIKRVFEYAWHRCNAFDARSGALKRRYRLIRQVIILITWLTTLLAVLAALSDFEDMLDLLLFAAPVIVIGYAVISTPFDQLKTSNPFNWIQAIIRNIFTRRVELLVFVLVFVVAIAFTALLQMIATGTRELGLKLLLIILPLLSTGLLAFASRFETGIAWVGFRLVSEDIRRKLFEMRVKMGMMPLTAADLESMRLHVLAQRARLDEMGIVTPLWGDPFQPDVEEVKPLYTDDPQDDGYKPMTLDDYVNWRLIHQTNWYRRRIRKDYGRTRSYRAWILFIGALGAFLAAADYGEFVAVTVAGVTALQAWLSLSEHEASYNIHVRTLLQLEDRIASYYINLKKIVDKPEKEAADRFAILDYVKKTENIFEEERTLWKNSVLQGQEATESSLAQLVSSTATDWQVTEDDEDKQPSGFSALLAQPAPGEGDGAGQPVPEVEEAEEVEEEVVGAG